MNMAATFVSNLDLMSSLDGAIRKGNKNRVRDLLTQVPNRESIMMPERVNNYGALPPNNYGVPPNQFRVMSSGSSPVAAGHVKNLLLPTAFDLMSRPTQQTNILKHSQNKPLFSGGSAAMMMAPPPLQPPPLLLQQQRQQRVGGGSFGLIGDTQRRMIGETQRRMIGGASRKNRARARDKEDVELVFDSVVPATGPATSPVVQPAAAQPPPLKQMQQQSSVLEDQVGNGDGGGGGGGSSRRYAAAPNADDEILGLEARLKQARRAKVMKMEEMYHKGKNHEEEMAKLDKEEQNLILNKGYIHPAKLKEVFAKAEKINNEISRIREKKRQLQKSQDTMSGKLLEKLYGEIKAERRKLSEGNSRAENEIEAIGVVSAASAAAAAPPPPIEATPIVPPPPPPSGKKDSITISKSAIECLVCKTVPQGTAIWTCGQTACDNIICNICKEKLRKCPTCKVHVRKTPLTRHRAIERILQVNSSTKASLPRSNNGSKARKAVGKSATQERERQARQMRRNLSSFAAKFPSIAPSKRRKAGRCGGGADADDDYDDEDESEVEAKRSLVMKGPYKSYNREGVIVEELKEGRGAEACAGRKVAVYYDGRLESTGERFDSCLKGKPFSFRLGAGEAISGWDLGVEGMKAGGKRRLTIPPELAYGAQGSAPVVPPNATLRFDVECKSVEAASGAAAAASAAAAEIKTEDNDDNDEENDDGQRNMGQYSPTTICVTPDMTM